MFSSKARLDHRTGPDGVDRLHYLQELVDEFQSTETATEHKLQILANLANFAYDPINYEFMRQLNVIDLFLDCLGEDTNGYSPSEFESLIEFAVGGLCNLALVRSVFAHFREILIDQTYIIVLYLEQKRMIVRQTKQRVHNKAWWCSIADQVFIQMIRAACLMSGMFVANSNEETVLSTITGMMFLMAPSSRPELTSVVVIEAMLQMSESRNPRLRNLATVFISDYCSPSQVESARRAQKQWNEGHDAPSASTSPAANG